MGGRLQQPRHLLGVADELDRFVEDLGEMGAPGIPPELWMRMRPGVRFAADTLRNWAEDEAEELSIDAGHHQALLDEEPEQILRQQGLVDVFWAGVEQTLLHTHNAHAGRGGWVVAEGRNATTATWLPDLEALAAAYSTPDPERVVLPVQPVPITMAEVRDHLRSRVIPRAIAQERRAIGDAYRNQFTTELQAVLADAARFGFTLTDLLDTTRPTPTPAPAEQ